MAIKAFVTGGTGFIGANLVAGLNELAIQARVLRRESSSLLALEGLTYETAFGDVLDPPEKLARAMEGCDWVFHVAAVSDYWRRDKSWLYRVNVDGTKHILAAAALAGVKRLVYTSSATALGLPADGEILDEESEFSMNSAGNWPYAHSKWLAEQEVRRACDEGLECVIVLPTVSIGPRDLNLVSGSIIVEAARGWGQAYPPGGTNFVAVEDVASGHIAATEIGRVGERYLLGGENLTFKEVAYTVCEIVGRPPPKFRIPNWFLPPMAVAVSGARMVLGNRVPFEARQVRISGENLYFDSSKAVQELGLSATPFRVAAQRAYDWYNSHGYIADSSNEIE